jgi:hypothetical protein
MFIETSAKTAQNIDEAFMSIAKVIYSKVQKGIIDTSTDVSIHYITLSYNFLTFNNEYNSY